MLPPVVRPQEYSSLPVACQQEMPGPQLALTLSIPASFAFPAGGNRAQTCFHGLAAFAD